MSPIQPTPRSNAGAWPALPSETWADTLETLHLWTQVVGKVRTERSPWRNHAWSSAIYTTPTGLTTGTIPYDGRTLEIAFDFLGHRLSIRTSDGRSRTFDLEPMTVAAFHERVMDALDELEMTVTIHPRPNEIEDPIPFADDTSHASYRPEHVEALHGALVQADRVMRIFQAGFVGKVSPVHFFWGSFDMAVTRFSGRTAPEHPGGIPNLPDAITREAYSHELTSCGFWPGNRDNPEPIFYAYAYPTPDGFSEADVRPDAAFWLDAMGEFALPYRAVRTADVPDDALLAFFESAHAAAAELAGWDRDALERPPGYRPVPRWSG